MNQRFKAVGNAGPILAFELKVESKQHRPSRSINILLAQVLRRASTFPVLPWVAGTMDVGQETPAAQVGQVGEGVLVRGSPTAATTRNKPANTCQTMRKQMKQVPSWSRPQNMAPDFRHQSLAVGVFGFSVIDFRLLCRSIMSTSTLPISDPSTCQIPPRMSLDTWMA